MEDDNINALDEMIKDQENLEEANRLTEWENPPKITDLKQDYQDASSDHDAQMNKISKWLDNLNITGSAKLDSSKNKGRSKIQPKLIRKQAEWRYASLSEPFLSTPDLFNADPVTFEDKQAAIQNGLVLNNQFNTKIKKVKFIDDFIRTTVNEGTAIIRVGWDYEEEVIEVEVPVTELVPVQDPIMAQQMLAQGQQPVQEVQVGTELQEQVNVIKNQPTLEVCDNKSIVIDPTCEGDLDKANFVIYSFETSLSELEKDGKYSNLDRINIDNNSILSKDDSILDDSASSFNFKDKPRKKFIAYEYWGYWDIHGEGTVEPIVATYVGDTLIRLEENPFPDKKLPFVAVQYLPVTKSVYGEPDGELLEDNQKVIGAVTRGMIDIMGRSANGQVGSRKDALDVTNKRKFDKGMDYEFNPQVDPRQAFFMHTFPEIPQSAHYMLDLQNNEAESISGVKAFSSGISGQALGATATGIRSALDATSKRELGILRRLSAGIVEVGRKVIAMNGEFLSEEETVRVTNDEFIPIRRDDLAGKFDLRLTISTAEADNEKAQELAFMLQTTAQSSDPQEVRMIRAEIARLRKMPELAKQIEQFEPQPDPLAEKIRELEIVKMEAEIQEIISKAEENQLDKELRKAQVQETLAKAKEISARADLADLAFLEKESGIDNEKEKEKIYAKAEGDILKERARQVNNQSKGNT